MNTRTTYRRVPTETVDVGGTRFAYRKLGAETGVPVIFLHHFSANIDDWDPRVIDGIAARHPVIAFDNRGVGASKGRTPTTVEAMARDAVAFIRALGYKQVDLFGFSLGGFVAQVIAQHEPRLVRRIVLAGTGPAGGEGIDRVTAASMPAVIRAALTFKDPKHYLFFSRTANGKAAARNYLKRLKERTDDRDKSTSMIAQLRQIKAIRAWGKQAPSDLSAIRQPVLVANGDHDVMVPTSNSVDLARRLPNAQLKIYHDAGHGGAFQYHEEFVPEVLKFLETSAQATVSNGQPARPKTSDKAATS
jgi:pimeloyl-ACP methyl ester carboxylesterase